MSLAKPARLRWHSDHVVTLTDEVQAIMQEIVRGVCSSASHGGASS